MRSMMSAVVSVCALSALVVPGVLALPGVAAAQGNAAQDNAAIANLTQHGRQAHAVYSQIAEPKAFAVAPDGAFAFYGGKGSIDEVMEEAVNRCRAVTTAETGCEVVSMNDEPFVAAGPGVAESLRSLPTGAAAGLRETVTADYRAAATPKALALGPDGAWGWMSGAETVEQARTEALQRCAEWGEGCTVSESQ
ncbi:MAG: hypothetical protein RLY86_2097 [Pseudomonadota bacterium]|jgi:hypothetical protein